MKQRIFLSGLLVLTPILVGGINITTTKAQSFSCANAQIPSEMAICNNEVLLIKDEKLAELFSAVLVSTTGSVAFQNASQAHADWLRKRNACKIDFSCLEQNYDERIRTLVEMDL
ncbi:MAG: hypothetical protein AAF217_04515 [Pseudomonadota bacterium]